MDIRIDKLLRWSQPVDVETSRGVGSSRMANPTSDFWGLWRAHKRQLKANGIRVVRNPHTNRYQVYWDEQPPVLAPDWTDAA
ncbi:MAG: hypothetical protein H0W33_03625 [Gammaproteobacteria bacterium]|nr:hypothetical protein [Gammaproteobacteria bacterium]